MLRDLQRPHDDHYHEPLALCVRLVGHRRRRRERARGHACGREDRDGHVDRGCDEAAARERRKGAKRAQPRDKEAVRHDDNAERDEDLADADETDREPRRR